ncbi:unnamed protein product [Calypogeia fissa]
MEDPLLDRRGSSGVNPEESTRKYHLFGRASAIASGDKYQKAAALVDLAEDGEGIPTEVLEQENSELATKLYFIYTKLRYVWLLNLAVVILLNFFEVPLWCKGDFPEPCGSKEKFYLGDLPYLSRWGSLGFEIVTLVILSVHTLFPILFMGRKLFWSNQLEVFKVVLVVLLIVDCILNTIYVSPSGAISTLPVRLAPYIRVVIVAANIPDVRYSIRTFVGILPDFTDVAALTLLFVLFSSWLAYVLFEDTLQGQEVFTSYIQTLYQMTVLFTTSNNPDVWLPAYKQSRFSSLFFIIYILIGVFFITNLVLAVVYDSFKGQLANYLVGVEKTRSEILDTTFNLLDEDGKGSLDLHQCSRLFKELNQYRTLPKINDEDMEAVFLALDDSGDFKINREEFEDLCAAISLKFDKNDQPQWLQEFPSLYNSYYFTKLREFVRSKTFDYIILGMLTLNLITVIIETTLDLEDDAAQKVWQEVELSFGWIYLVELVLKVLVYGFNNYWRSGANRFDFFITWIIVIGETLAFALPDGLPFLNNSEWIRYLLIARLLRLVRVLMQFERFRVKLTTFLNLIPNLLRYLGIIFFLLCIYCSVGVQTFGGLVYEGNPKLIGTSMEEDDYFVHNFNDYPTGMVTLFNLLVMGNWQNWLETYAVLSPAWWAALYFLSFYVIAVLFLLNLIVAFVLEAFFAEIDIAEEVKEVEREEQSIPGSQSRDPKSEKARLRARRGKDNRVQNLLNHMLSAEMEKSKSIHGHAE